MKKFEILEHAADIKIKVYGRDLNELFGNAVLGMVSVQKTNYKKQKTKKSQITNYKTIKIESIDTESLLIDFLSQVLALSDINHVVYPEVNILKLTGKEIEAKIYGFNIDHFDEEIKAVTYHNIKIEKVDDVWQTVIVFDI